MPSASDSPDESRLTVAPKAIRDLIEHFPFPRGPKYDPKLIWKFEDQEIFLRGQDASLEAEGAILFLPFLGMHNSNSFAHGKNRERLDHRTLPQCLRVRGIRRLRSSRVDLLPHPRISGIFHPRIHTSHTLDSRPRCISYTQATLLLAEHLGLNLIIRFLDSTSPIYIEIEGDLADTLFVIATSQIIDADNPPSSHASSRGQQNGRTAKVVQRPQQQQQHRIPSGKRKRGSELDAEAEGGTDNLNDDGDRNDADDDSLYAIRDVQAGSRASSVASSRKRPMKAAVKADRDSIAREMVHTSQRRPPSSSLLSRSQALVNAIIPPLTPPPPPASMPPPSLPNQSISRDERKKEPLFLPGSQLSQAIHDSGWGMLEGMDADEFDRMMEDGDELDDKSEGVDTHTHTSSKKPSGVSRNPSSRSDTRIGDADQDVQMQEAQNPNPNSSSFFGDSEEIDQLADDEDSMVPGDLAQAQDRESSFGLYYDETETQTQFGPTQPRSELGMSSAGSADVSKVRYLV